MSETATVDVLFRVTKGRDGGDVTAIISDPDAVTFNARGEATCYARVGQHSTCSVRWYIESTRKAKPEEFESLKKELESIGYILNIRQKRKVR